MKFYSRIILISLIVLMSSNLFSQVERDKDSILLTERYIVFEGDTLLIELDEVLLLNKLKFKTNYEQRYYFWFRKKVLKAYPYAKIAAERIEVINEKLTNIKSKRKKKKYIKQMQNYMEGEFVDQLKKLTRTEGRILIKLIHRQSGIVTYDLIKDYRSGWKAFWYNTAAGLYKLSLKEEYDPFNNDEDFLIEDILQRAFIDGILEEQPPKVAIDHMQLSKKSIKIPKPKPKKH